MYEKGYTKEDVINLFRFIDWVMSLPKELEDEFWTEVTNFEEERRMPYITSVERRGIQKGQAAIVIRQLNRKLGSLSSELESEIKSLEIEQIEALGEDLLDFASVDDLRGWLANHTPAL